MSCFFYCSSSLTIVPNVIYLIVQTALSEALLYMRRPDTISNTYIPPLLHSFKEIIKLFLHGAVIITVSVVSSRPFVPLLWLSCSPSLPALPPTLLLRHLQTRSSKPDSTYPFCAAVRVSLRRGYAKRLPRIDPVRFLCGPRTSKSGQPHGPARD